MKCEATEVRQILEKVIKDFNAQSLEDDIVKTVMTKHPDWDSSIVRDFVKKELKYHKGKRLQG